MTAWQNILRLGLLGILILTIADPVSAQRGDGRGRGGQQGGQSGNQGGGGRGGRGGGEVSGRSGGDARRSFSQGSGQRSSSEGQSMRRTYRQGDRNDARSQVQTGEQQRSQFRSGDQQRLQGQGQGQRQQSFFRGPDSDRNNAQQRDRSSFDNQRFDNERDSGRNARSRFDGRQSDRDGRDADWRNRVFDDNRLTGDRARNESRARIDDRDWSRTADRIRDNWYRRDRDNLPFRYGWWDNAGVNRWPVLSPWRYSRWQDRPYYWWGWTPAPTLTNWLVFGWDRPYYWDYGPGGNIVYRDNYVYYDNQRYLADDQYYRQVHDLAHSVPSVDANSAQQMEWQPLGVFAATPGSETSQRTLQLAVNKNGVLSGTYYNPQNEHVHPLLGMVDDRTQRAAWAFADGEHPDVVFETSIYNLTEPQSTMMVHFGPSADDVQIWRLVRLERPEAQTSSQPAPQTTRRELP